MIHFWEYHRIILFVTSRVCIWRTPNPSSIHPKALWVCLQIERPNLLPKKMYKWFLKTCHFFVFTYYQLLSFFVASPLSSWVRTCECTWWGAAYEGSVRLSPPPPQPTQELTSRCLSLSDLTGSVTVKIADEGDLMVWGIAESALGRALKCYLYSDIHKRAEMVIRCMEVFLLFHFSLVDRLVCALFSVLMWCSA